MHTSLTSTAKMGCLVVGFCLETWKRFKCQSSMALCANSLEKNKQQCFYLNLDMDYFIFMA